MTRSEVPQGKDMPREERRTVKFSFSYIPPDDKAKSATTEAVAQKTQAPIIAKQTVSRRYVHTYHMGICIFIKFSVIDVRKKPFEAKGEVLLTNIQFV